MKRSVVLYGIAPIAAGFVYFFNLLSIGSGAFGIFVLHAMFPQASILLFIGGGLICHSLASVVETLWTKHQNQAEYNKKKKNKDIWKNWTIYEELKTNAPLGPIPRTLQVYFSVTADLMGEDAHTKEKDKVFSRETIRYYTEILNGLPYIKEPPRKDGLSGIFDPLGKPRSKKDPKPREETLKLFLSSPNSRKALKAKLMAKEPTRSHSTMPPLYKKPR